VREKPDITMPELAAELASLHNVEVDPASLSRFLRKAGLSYKKNAAGQRARSL
jgi:transposase